MGSFLQGGALVTSGNTVIYSFVHVDSPEIPFKYFSQLGVKNSIWMDMFHRSLTNKVKTGKQKLLGSKAGKTKQRKTSNLILIK